MARPTAGALNLDHFGHNFRDPIRPHGYACGKRRGALSEAFERLLGEINRRISVFDEEAARQAAQLSAYRQKKGIVVELRDTMIAGIVLARKAAIATRSVTHFSDIAANVINPWEA